MRKKNSFLFCYNRHKIIKFIFTFYLYSVTKNFKLMFLIFLKMDRNYKVATCENEILFYQTLMITNSNITMVVFFCFHDFYSEYKMKKLLSSMSCRIIETKLMNQQHSMFFLLNLEIHNIQVNKIVTRKKNNNVNKKVISYNSIYIFLVLCNFLLNDLSFFDCLTMIFSIFLLFRYV